MSVNLDLLAKVKAMSSEVKASKQKGKAGRKARKKLASSENEFEKVKQMIKDVSEACERNAWKPTKLIMEIFPCTCKHCGASSTQNAVYLEKRHEKAGTIRTRLDQFHGKEYPHLPRAVLTHPTSYHICPICFVNHQLLPERQLKVPPTIIKHFPRVPLLTHQQETV